MFITCCDQPLNKNLPSIIQKKYLLSTGSGTELNSHQKNNGVTEFDKIGTLQQQSVKRN